MIFIYKNHDYDNNIFITRENLKDFSESMSKDIMYA